MWEVVPFSERARLCVAEIAAVKRLAAEIGLRDDIVVDHGDMQRSRGDRAQRRVERGESHQPLRAVAAAAYEQDPDRTVLDGGRELVRGVVFSLADGLQPKDSSPAEG